MAKDPDLSVLKTAEAIKDAFIALLEHKDFAEISVKDIIEQARINRSTFYAHYPNKNALVAALAANVKHTLAQAEQKYRHATFKDFAEQFAPLLFAQRRLIQALWKIDTPKTHFYRDMFAVIKQKHLHDYPADNDFQAELFASIALSSLRYYFAKDEQIQVEQWLADIAAVCHKMLG